MHILHHEVYLGDKWGWKKKLKNILRSHVICVLLNLLLLRHLYHKVHEGKQTIPLNSLRLNVSLNHMRQLHHQAH